MLFYVFVGVVAVVLAVWMLWEAEHGQQDKGEGDRWDSR